MSIAKLVTAINEFVECDLNPDAYNGYHIKEMTTSSSLAERADGHGYHIEITGTDSAMRIFPIVTNSHYLADRDSKREYYLKLRMRVHRDNLYALTERMLGDYKDYADRCAKRGATLNQLEAYYHGEKQRLAALTGMMDSYSYCALGIRATGQNQFQIGRSDDEKNILLLRYSLVPGDWLVFLRRGGATLSYDVVGLPESTEGIKDLSPTWLAPSASNNVSSEDILIEGDDWLKSAENCIYFGPPGTGKSHKVEQVTHGRNKTIITFHPDFDHEDFVGGYRPVSVSSGDQESKLQYRFVPQSFLIAYVQAWSNPQKEYAVVVEEINRGNCAQIFGNLFQLIERADDGFSRYTSTADAHIQCYLRDVLADFPQYSEKAAAVYQSRNHRTCDDPFSFMALPSNLSIYATMNSSDQALFPMDSAFKRRWDWIYVPIDYMDAERFRIEHMGKQYSWTNFLRAVNEKIYLTTESEDKLIGNRFVSPSDGLISSSSLKNKIMFYLWSDVFREELPDNENYVFRYQSDSESREFRYPELFEENGDQILEGFFSYNGIMSIDGDGEHDSSP
jgi:hypothetical protein